MTHIVSAALAFHPAGERTPTVPETVVGPSDGVVQSDPGAEGSRYPLRRQPFVRSWPLHPTAVRLAWVHARTWLAIAGWSGDQGEALLVVQEVMRNGVRHPTHAPADGTVQLSLSITEDGLLVIDVTAPDPEFPGFDFALPAGPDTGLGLVRALGGEVTWGAPDVEHGKTVRVRMRPHVR
ncbi:ATP-binding protein [Streptomyces sp. NPDC051985]|uniref:ATP-binding protein n=1 Tax=Streptomyces sp. NPDC051985 TaxID=3155807 RepID=UPI003432ED65